MVETPLAVLEERYRSASDAVATALQTDPQYTVPMAENASPLLNECASVWQRRYQVAGRVRTIQLGLPSQFPYEPPLACVLEWEDLVLENPHVQDGGLLCVIPDSAAINVNDPVGLVLHVFQESAKLVEGTNPDDFREEFSYYWNLRTTDGTECVVLVDPVSQLGTTFSTVSIEGVLLAAASEEKLNQWLANARAGSVPEGSKGTGVVLHLGKTLLPREYPDSLGDLVALADANDVPAARLLKERIAQTLDRGLALLVQDERYGETLGAVVFDGLGLRWFNRREVNKGFRPGNVPIGLLMTRSKKRLECTTVERSNVIRVDQERIHVRGGDGRDLSQKSVLVIGAGSLGGHVNYLLSRAGVGRITIVDKETLSWANLGRHILGAPYIGQWKARALAKELSRQMPHLEVSGIIGDWRELLRDQPDMFNSYDVVLSTTASWRSEALLNSLARQVQIPRVLFGWLEPFAVAGHCLTLGTEGGVLTMQDETSMENSARASASLTAVLFPESQGDALTIKNMAR